jgi:hypothetical protein
MNTLVLTNQASAAMKVANEHHWQFKVLGTGKVLTEPIYTDSWWLTPATKIPAAGLKRVDALRKAGIPIKGFVIAHEAPKLLAAPKEEPKPQPTQTSSSIPSFDASFILEGALLAFGLIFRAMLIDPALIVVLEDGTYLEVLTWLD